MGFMDIGLKKETKELLERLLNLVDTIVEDKEIVIRISLDKKTNDKKRNW